MSTPSSRAPTTTSSSGASSTSARSNSSNSSYAPSSHPSTSSLPHSNFSTSSPSICSFPSSSASSSSSSSHQAPAKPRHTPFDHHVLALHRFIFERHAHRTGSIEYQVTDLFIDDRMDELDEPVYLAELEKEELAVRHDRLAAVVKELREWKIEAVEMEVVRAKLEVAWRERKEGFTDDGAVGGEGEVRGGDGGLEEEMLIEEEVDAAVEKIRRVFEWLREKGDRAREPRELLEKALKALVVGEDGCAG